MSRLLVVDDDMPVADVIYEIGKNHGFEVRLVTQSREFQAAYSQFKPDVLTLDLLMPDLDGFEILSYLREQGCRARIIILSGAGEHYLHMAHEIASLGRLHIDRVLAKPTQIGELYELLSQRLSGDESMSSQ